MNKFSSLFQKDIAAIMSTVEGALAEDRQEKARPIDTGPSRFIKLCEVFRLTDAEIDMVRCLIAQSVDPTLSGKFEAQTGFTYVSELLLRQSFGHGIEPIYPSDSTLNIWRLAHARDMGPGQPIAFELDLAVLEWLAGKPGLEPRLLRRLIRAGKASEAFSGLYADPQAPRWMQVGLTALCGGAIFLLVSFVRERLFAFKRDRYREVDL